MLSTLFSKLLSGPKGDFAIGSLGFAAIHQVHEQLPASTPELTEVILQTIVAIATLLSLLVKRKKESKK